MKNKQIKKKEVLRDYLLKKLENYRNKKEIHFFDKSAYDLSNYVYTIPENDIEAFLIKLDKYKKILVTTQSFYIIDKSTITKIHINEIEDYDYIPFDNLETIQNAPLLKRVFNKYQLLMHIGDIRIRKKDGSFLDLYISKRKFLYCLTGAIIKLKSINFHYVGV
ncbi:hypothetical protein CXF68_20330 [Tenacibaculum sp. Bg11-29]|uniref:hypothetical protein n=1 Tax=Tenacibaculum sp. Bg11-29 TaxID=2058306 RepID=UPI000C33CA0B|nr:hypothetical protein [Tenacibaculum sp. Bg11-29]PKH52902.1 hypothetical protein CXF68_20330 [Tenacibaculum sp. Bg11-29]